MRQLKITKQVTNLRPPPRRVDLMIAHDTVPLELAYG